MREREREGERERQTDRQTETDRQTNRQTDRQRIIHFARTDLAETKWISSGHPMTILRLCRN